MKKFSFSVVIMLTVMIATSQSADYDAANWKTWLLDNPQQITFKAPPSAVQTKAEVATVKLATLKVDADKMAAIKYWNAGAPSYRWNQVAINLIDQKPEIQLRMPASCINMAIYDATILAWKQKLANKRKRPHDMDPTVKTSVSSSLTYSYPCEHSVTAAAAAYTLAYFFPDKADSILKMARAASQSRIDAGVQFPSDVEEGWKLGEQVAKEIIEKAKNDGSANKYTGAVNKDPKKWTGPYPMGITLSSFTPMVLRTADQFRLPPPPDFENDMKELKNFKRTGNSNYIAYYWANNGPGLWNDLASQKMFENRIMDNTPEASRIYTVLSVAFHDAAIAIFDSKYAYWGIRPNQYDTTYKSLISTPPFPGYPSGHAAGAATTSAVLGYFFPADAKQFQKLAQECADSRFYAGIHFRTDNESALRMGNDLGKFIVETWMKK
jgi:membrane-associated phospholipid phosphatase